MPAIPTYEQRTQAQGQINIDALRGSSAMLGPANALQNFSGVFREWGEDARRRQQQEEQALKVQEEKDGRAYAGATLSDATLSWTDKLAQQQETASPGAFGFTPSILKDFDADASSRVNEAPTPAAKQYLRESLNHLRTQIGGRALEFEARSRVAFRDEQAVQAADNWAKVVQQDPMQYLTASNALRETLPNGNDKLKDYANRSLIYAAASSMLDRDPAALKEATGKAMGEGDHKGPTGVPWVDAMTPEQVQHWNAQAEVKIRQAEAAAARDTDASAKLAVDSVQKLRTFITDGQVPSMDYQREVRMLTRGTPWEKEAEALIETGMKGAGFGAQTLPRQAIILQQLEGKPTDPTTAKQVQHARSVFDAQTAAYRADPWDAAARFQGLPPQQVQPITNGQQLLQLAQQRVPLMNQLETSSGQPAPLLRPTEVPRAVQALAAVPPLQRGELLSQIAVALDRPDRVAALAAQLGREDRPSALALILGREQHPSAVAATGLILRGAQALADKTVKKDDSAMFGWRSDIAEIVRGSIGYDKVEQDIIDAALYVRAAFELDGVAPRTGGVFGTGPNKSVEAALDLVMGQPLRRGGKYTFLPRDVSESEFDDKARAQLQGMGAAKVYVRGQEIPASLVASRWDSYALKMAGNGRYIPVVNNAFITVDAGGRKPLIIEVR